VEVQALERALHRVDVELAKVQNEEARVEVQVVEALDQSWAQHLKMKTS
jgi:hypothetical protein